MTALPIQVTFDAADPERQAGFWAAALEYVVQPPPPGHESWEAFAESIGHPELKGTISAIVDPEGKGPRLLFVKVPEAKVAKNRMHLDVNAGSDARERKVDQLVALGAAVVREMDERGERWTVLTDPEGNEFCVQ